MPPSHDHENTEFMVCPFPPADDVPACPTLKFSISTKRLEHVPRWRGKVLVDTLTVMTSIMFQPPSDTRFGAVRVLEALQAPASTEGLHPLLARLLGRFPQVPGPIQRWLREQAEDERRALIAYECEMQAYQDAKKQRQKDDPTPAPIAPIEPTPGRVFVQTLSTPRGGKADEAVNLPLKLFAEITVNRKIGLRPVPHDTRVGALLRNRRKVKGGSEEDLLDLLITGRMRHIDDDSSDISDPNHRHDFLVFVVPDDEGVMIAAAIEEVFFNEHEVGGQKVPPFIEYGAVQILEQFAPNLAKEIRDANKPIDLTKAEASRPVEKASEPKKQEVKPVVEPVKAAEKSAEAKPTSAKPSRRARGGTLAEQLKHVAVVAQQPPEKPVEEVKPVEEPPKAEAVAAPPPVKVAEAKEPAAKPPRRRKPAEPKKDESAHAK